MQPDTEIKPITDLERWCREHGAAELVANKKLTVQLDEEAKPLIFDLTERAEIGDYSLTCHRPEDRPVDMHAGIIAITPHTVSRPDTLARFMADLASDTIAHAVTFEHSNQPNPANLDLIELSEHERYALPAQFHWPMWSDLGNPAMWLCAVCWGDALAHQWPCAAASRRGRLVAKAIGLYYTR